MKGRIHSFETFGSVDGPGVRFVVFMQGCRMRCRYCHNPDTWKINAGEEFDSAQVVRKALRYRSYWGRDGGVTVSGGEALLQIGFLTELFRMLKSEGVNTCLDTAAGPFRDDREYLEIFDELMRYTDLVMLDIKQIDNAAHKALTGIENTAILKCAQHLSTIGKDMWIRHVLVPGVTDDEQQLRQLREFIDTLDTVKKVEVLPYHSMGMFKWDNLGIPYTLKGVDSPDEESLARVRQILKA